MDAANRCPRCLGNLAWDTYERECYCLACGGRFNHAKPLTLVRERVQKRSVEPAAPEHTFVNNLAAVSPTAAHVSGAGRLVLGSWRLT